MSLFHPFLKQGIFLGYRNLGGQIFFFHWLPGLAESCPGLGKSSPWLRTLSRGVCVPALLHTVPPLAASRLPNPSFSAAQSPVSAPMARGDASSPLGLTSLHPHRNRGQEAHGSNCVVSSLKDASLSWLWPSSYRECLTYFVAFYDCLKWEGESKTSLLHHGWSPRPSHLFLEIGSFAPFLLLLFCFVSVVPCSILKKAVPCPADLPTSGFYLRLLLAPLPRVSRTLVFPSGGQIPFQLISSQTTRRSRCILLSACTQCSVSFCDVSSLWWSLPGFIFSWRIWRMVTLFYSFPSPVTYWMHL